jgi:hypothetical protein
VENTPNDAGCIQLPVYINTNVRIQYNQRQGNERVDYTGIPATAEKMTEKNWPKVTGVTSGQTFLPPFRYCSQKNNVVLL